MDVAEFRKQAHELVEWMAGYLEDIREYPVRSRVQPGDIYNQLPDLPPEKGEDFNQIFDDFKRIILPGITHWQHPRFFAYFPANSSPPSLLAEMLMATMGAQCMIWQTSPAAAELEEKVMHWLARMLGLPEDFSGVIQDTASTATLVSLLTARERYTDFRINKDGFQALKKRFVVYSSAEAHSSIDKAVRIAGIGEKNLRKIPVDGDFRMIPDELEAMIRKDREKGLIPLWVTATLGTTGSTAVDPLKPIGEICRHYDLWLHVDAAFSGTALLLEEMRWMINGIEMVDSFVFNPHKWMFTNFDCSAYFVKDEKALIRTFEIHPEYLKTSEDRPVKNYRDWGIQLGRRFRALKLWFVIRTYGVEGLKQKIRQHIQLAKELELALKAEPDFEILAPVQFPLVCFHYHPPGLENQQELNRINTVLLERLNNSGKIYLSHTSLRGNYTLRMVTAQTNVTADDVWFGWDLIKKTARDIA